MCIQFGGDSDHTGMFALKALLGGVNAISGETVDLNKAPQPNPKQDYLVVPGQWSLGGFAMAPGEVKQFVAVPYVSGYSIEQQVSKHRPQGMRKHSNAPPVDRQRDCRRHSNPGDFEIPASPKQLGWLLGHDNAARARVRPWWRTLHIPQLPTLSGSIATDRSEPWSIFIKTTEQKSTEVVVEGDATVRHLIVLLRRN